MENLASVIFPVLCLHAAPCIVRRLPCHLAKRGLCLTAVLVIRVTDGMDGSVCLMAETDHVIVGVIGILVCIAFFIPYTHQAVQKIIRHLIRLAGRRIRRTVYIPLTVIAVAAQCLLFLCDRTVIVLLHQTALGVILITQGIPVRILCFKQLSVLLLVFIRNNGRSGDGHQPCLSKLIVAETIIKSVVRDPCQAVIGIAVFYLYLLILPFCLYRFGHGGQTFCFGIVGIKGCAVSCIFYAV